MGRVSTVVVPQLSFLDLKRLCEQQAFALVGVLSADTTRETLSHHRAKLEEWQSEGFAGGMRFMQRDSALLTDPDRLVPGFQSIAIFAVPYSDPAIPAPPLPAGHGRVARYAWGEDYHLVFQRRLQHLLHAVGQHVGAVVEGRFFADAVPLLERSVASAAGLGFLGKNSLLIREGEGSYFFLAEVVWNVRVVEVPPVQRRVKDFFAVLDSSQPKLRTGCGTCQTCIDRCPTKAIVRPGVVDARRCISYLTIEKRGPFSEEERRAVGSWIFGCDECQEVCPYTAGGRPAQSIWKEFSSASGVGSSIDLESVLTLRSEREFELRFRNTPLLRARRSGLIRNAAAVAANTRAVSLAPQLCDLAKEDRSETVRTEARAALSILHDLADGATRGRIAAVLGR